MPQPLSETELFDRLRLLRSRNVGPVGFRQLLHRYGNARSALDALPDLARRGGGKAVQIAPVEAVERELVAVRAMNANWLAIDDPAYPPALAQLSNAPPLLIYRGRIALLQQPQVAVVGARNASAAAVSFARTLAHDLAAQGLTVVSGLARGIDTAAHAGAGPAQTAAVIAGGQDVYFPPENERLQEAIAEQGLLISEQPPRTQPTARHFPYRNRIIAGLGHGTVVVEAAMRSGSLITARLAGEYGREVMAVPGSPLDPRSKGCNELIRNGATLVQGADDVIELITPFDPAAALPGRLAAPLNDEAFDYFPGGEDNEPLDSDRQRFVALLGHAPVAVAELIRQSRVTAAQAQLFLLELELADRLARHAGGKVSLRV